MRPGVEDHLLRELVRTEVNRSDDARLMAATYERLADALRNRQPLSGLLGQDARRAGRAEDDSMMARLRSLGSASSYFSRSPHALENLHEVATLVDRPQDKKRQYRSGRTLNNDRYWTWVRGFIDGSCVRLPAQLKDMYTILREGRYPSTTP
jgi:hypothetical protein